MNLSGIEAEGIPDPIAEGPTLKKGLIVQMAGNHEVGLEALYRPHHAEMPALSPDTGIIGRFMVQDEPAASGLLP